MCACVDMCVCALACVSATRSLSVFHSFMSKHDESMFFCGYFFVFAALWSADGFI